MKYIITDEMLTQWRTGCFRPRPQKRCDRCPFDGVGARKNCCEFDDNAMERIFQSVKYEREIKCPKCGGATFWNNTDGKDTCFCMNDSCKWQQAITATETQKPILPGSERCFSKRIRHDATICKDVLQKLDGPETSIEDFLDWVADRLVYVHHENEHVDYVISLRSRAKAARKIRCGDQR